MEHDAKPRKKIGRPRSFDRDIALSAAMKAFWAHGYETTSISDLKAAMGMNAPAIYGAFGNKEKLFLEAVALYRGDPEVEALLIRDAASGKDAARMIFEQAIALFTSSDNPTGCLVSSSLASGSEASAHIRAKGSEIRSGVEDKLATRIQRDIDDDILPASADPKALAASVTCTIQGFSTLARDGASSAKLQKIADIVLAGWPAAESGISPS